MIKLGTLGLNSKESQLLCLESPVFGRNIVFVCMCVYLFEESPINVFSLVFNVDNLIDWESKYLLYRV